MRVVLEWIQKFPPGPGIGVGRRPGPLFLDESGDKLFVANQASLDVSVVDLISKKELRRIYTRSPVNGISGMGEFLLLTTLGVGSGHPKGPDPNRESLDPKGSKTEFTLFRDPQTAKPYPLDQQKPLGPYDFTDGTAQEKFRDITNDLVLLKKNGVKRVDSYQATEGFTRYTSDSFEGLMGDKKGDVPPDLMRVSGAFPESLVRDGNRFFVTMGGTFQVQEWFFEPKMDPLHRLKGGRVFPTGFRPMGMDIFKETLVVANSLGESLSFIELGGGDFEEVKFDEVQIPFPANDFERGEFFVQTSVFSVDQDQSCVHCHYRDTSDGKKWSVSQVMGQTRQGEEVTGGSREVPDLRALAIKVPFFVEGTLSIDEPLTMMMEHNPLIDFQGITPAGDFSNVFRKDSPEEMPVFSADGAILATGKSVDLEKGVGLEDLLYRREVHFRNISKKYLGEEFSFRQFQKFIGAYQEGESRLLPNPVVSKNEAVLHGEKVFFSPQVACAGCHIPPTFTDKTGVFNQNRSFPPLVTPGNRDNVHTLVSADRFDRIFGYRALKALPYPRPFPSQRASGKEIGRNELNGVPDLHGATSHLSTWDIYCLESYLESIP